MQLLQPSGAVPIITVQPQSITVVGNTFATFSVTAVGVGLTYAWYTAHNGSSNFLRIPNQTNSTLQILAIYPQSVLQQYYVIVTNNSGSVTSNIVLLNVLPTTPFNGAGPILGRFRYTQA